jgi:hypothetical protein
MGAPPGQLSMAFGTAICSLYFEFCDPYFDSYKNKNHHDPALFGDNSSPAKYSDKELEVDRRSRMESTHSVALL